MDVIETIRPADDSAAALYDAIAKVRAELTIVAERRNQLVDKT